MPAVKVTAGWNDATGRTHVQREKEHADDYRYFPDADVLPLVLDEDQIQKWCQELPELPEAREARFVSQYGLPAYDAAVLTASRPVADFYEAAAAHCKDSKMVSNWIMGELLRLLKGNRARIRTRLCFQPLLPPKALPGYCSWSNRSVSAPPTAKRSWRS